MADPAAHTLGSAVAKKATHRAIRGQVHIDADMGEKSSAEKRAVRAKSR